MKRCIKCGQWKPATPEYFNRTALYQSPDGLNKQCIECRKAYRKVLKNVPPKKAHQGYKICVGCKQEYPATTEFFYGDKTAKYGVGYRCKPCQAAYQSSLFANKKQVSSKRCSKCKEIKPATIKYFSTDAYTLDGWTRQCKMCRNAHNQISRTTQQRRIWKHRNGGIHTAQEIEQQYERQQGKCYYCHKRIVRYHIDHIIPLSRGGSNDISNLVLACPSCNLSKGNKLLYEWRNGGRLL